MNNMQLYQSIININPPPPPPTTTTTTLSLRKMTEQLLKFYLNLGKFLAFTPDVSDKPPKYSRVKIYAASVMTLITLTVLASNYLRLELYDTFGQMKLVIAILIETVLYSFNVHTVMNAAFWKTKQWRTLLQRLDQTGSKLLPVVPTKLPHWAQIAIPQLCFAIVAGYHIYVWTVAYSSWYCAEFLMSWIQFYYKFSYMMLVSVMAKLLLVRFKYFNSMLYDQLDQNPTKKADCSSTENFVVTMRHIQRYFHLLKEYIEMFNELFGWPILLVIFYASMRLLNDLDDIFKNSYRYDGKSYLNQIILTNVSVVATCLAIAVVVILDCDAVLREAARTISICYDVRRHFSDLRCKEREEINRFVDFVLNHYPEFSAAGFIHVNKTTIFHLLGTTTTYLIVVIQFNVSN